MKLQLEKNALGYSLLLLCGCLWIYYSYTQFWDASWTFDGKNIFADLPWVGSKMSVFEFILKDREISPTGRPLSIASFLLNITDWPSNPAGFRRINTLIHLINTLLLSLVAFRIGNLIPSLKPHKLTFGVLLAITWGMHPFVASSSFHIVQRMALLSGTCTLLAFLAYLHGRELVGSSMFRGYLWLIIGTAAFGLLGVLFKESALLIPILIGITEIFLLSRYNPVDAPYFSAWSLSVLLIPLGVLVLYTLSFSFHADSVYVIRPFSLSDRIFSEGIILFFYIGQILLPRINLMGPFQDDLSYIHTFEPFTIAALLAWIILITLSYFQRKKWPHLSFCVFFFLAAHLLESTVFNLELYYEHRNYIASIAILGVFLAILITSKLPIIRSIAILYSLIIAGLLWSLSTLWGHPVLAPISWAENHPTSIRASQVLTTMLWNTGKAEDASNTILAAYLRMPQSSELAASIFSYTCINASKTEEYSHILSTIVDRANQMHYGRSISQIMFSVLDQKQSGRCANLDSEKVTGFLKGLLDNPRFKDKRQRFAYNLLINRFALLQNDRQEAVLAHYRAYMIKPWSGGQNKVYCDLISIGETNLANEIIRKYKERKHTDEKPIQPSCPFPSK